MIVKITSRIFVFGIVAIGLQGCFAAKEYASPEVEQSSQFHTDAFPKDSTTVATVSWRDIFSDPQLVEHINHALENNIDVRVAIEQLSIAESYFKQGKAGNIPTLSAGAQVTHQQLSKNSQLGAFLDGSSTQYELTGSLSWEADIWGKIRSTKRASHATLMGTMAVHQAVKSRLVANVASLYFQLQAVDEQLAVAQQTLENRRSSLETTQALKDAGVLTEVAVNQTEAQVYTAEAITIDLNQQAKLLENTFSILLGVEPQPITRSPFDESTVELDEQNTGYPVQLLANRPDVRAAEMSFRNAFELTNVARSQFYPSLSISATGGLQSIQLDQLFSLNSLFANIVGSLTQPILNRRSIKTQYEVAQSQQQIAYLDFKQALLNASREVSNAVYSREAAALKSVAKSNEFEAYQLATDHSEALLDSGLANYLEVLTARQNALNARLSLIDAKYATLSSTVELYRALGGGWQ